MKELILQEPLLSIWQGKDPFREAADLRGDVVRHKEGRETIRCELGGEIFYRKFHSGVGWREILKNYLLLRAPVVDASNEWRAIQLLQKIGVKTLTAVGYGRTGINPASRRSFLITRELKDSLSTAVFTEHWPVEPPAYDLRMAMIVRLAEITREIHRSGMNHRDLYLCHFLIDLSVGRDNLNPGNVDFFLVDLHRAQIRRAVPQRWLVKDLASIYFSALDIGLTTRDVLRFLRVYYNQPLRRIFKEQGPLFVKVRRKARKLYLRDFKKEPQFPL